MVYHPVLRWSVVTSKTKTGWHVKGWHLKCFIGQQNASEIEVLGAQLGFDQANWSCGMGQHQQTWDRKIMDQSQKHGDMVAIDMDGDRVIRIQPTTGGRIRIAVRAEDLVAAWLRQNFYLPIAVIGVLTFIQMVQLGMGLIRSTNVNFSCLDIHFWAIGFEPPFDELTVLHGYCPSLSHYASSDS